MFFFYSFEYLCASCRYTKKKEFLISVLLLLKRNVIRLSQSLYFRYPCFENPYPMDIHESPVTSCQYFADCQTDLIPALYSVGSSKHKRSGFSEKVWISYVLYSVSGLKTLT